MLLLFVTLAGVRSASPVVVIGHRGASGHLPEHTLPSKALAYGQGVDYLEQDVALSQDNVPIVIHDIYLDEVSDVAAVFPGRNRSNGRFYVIDFTVAEIKQLAASERFNHRTGKPVFPNRFPLNQSTFHLVTLAEELEFIAGLNKVNAASGRQVGAYVEIKDPSFHVTENRGNFSEIVLDILYTYGYINRTDLVYLQCFDVEELKRIREELKSDLKLVALLTDNKYRSEYSKTDYVYWTSAQGVESLAKFVDGVGPHHSQLYEQRNILAPSELYHEIRKHELVLHPYTFRSDVDLQPFASFDAMLKFFIDLLQIDGLFTDQPDTVIQYLRTKRGPPNGARQRLVSSLYTVLLSIVMLTL